MAQKRHEEIESLSYLKKAFVWIALAYMTGYLAWRAGFTMNSSNPAYSISFLAAEVLGLLSSFQFVASTYRLRKRVAPPAPEKGVSVDVFIPTFNEDAELLETTIDHCLRMDYPHETYVLDDGRRPEIERLARRMGAKYITRPDNKNAKAGNINNALSKTSGDLVLVMDADGIPHRELLVKILGYFKDPEVAMVQVPQTFYNLDSFQHSNVPTRKRIWHDQGLWFDVLQRGRDYHEAAMCCGSGSITRRSALEKIGGMPTNSLTEDMLMSLKFHEEGMKTVYHHESLQFCLAPANLDGFVTQRARWARGGVQTMRLEFSKLFGPSGLTLMQRFLYLPLFYLTSIQRAFYLSAPFLYIVVGLAPIDTANTSLVPMFINCAVSIALYYILARGEGRLIQNEMFFLYNIGGYLKGVVLGLFPFTGRFKVTSKRIAGGSVFATQIPSLCLWAMMLFSAGWGFDRWSETGDAVGLGISFIFANFYAALGFMALIRSAKSSTREDSYAFFDPRPLQVLAIDGAPCMSNFFGIASVVSEKGLIFHQTHGLPTNSLIRIGIELPEGVIEAEGTVSSSADNGSFHKIEIHFTHLSPDARMSLIRYFFAHATPRVLSDYSIHVERATSRHAHERRGNGRTPALAPVSVRRDGVEHGEQMGMVVDISERGSRMRSRGRIEVGSRIQVWIPWENRMIHAAVVRCEEPGQADGEFDLGLSFDQPEQLSRVYPAASMLPA